MRHRPASSLEALESRIAPASITVGTYTVSTSKGTTGDLTNAAVFDTGGDGHLISLTLGAKFKGSDVTVTNSQGVGIAFVGLIEATGFDLGRVVIDGDLGQINAGDAVASTPGLTKLEVKSLGTTLTTQAPGGDVDSHVQGKISTLLVHGNIGGTLNLDGPGGVLGTATIDGSLNGGTATNSGSIIVNRSIGSIKVSGNLLGGDGDGSGAIVAHGSITRAEITGNITGGKGSNSGALSADGELTVGIVGGSITGGTDAMGGANSGRIFAGGKIGQLTVTGTLTGGKTLSSGNISAGNGGIDSVTVSGGLIGGDAKDSGTVATSGVLRKAIIGTAEEGMHGGAGEHSGSLLSSVRIANVTVHGDIAGGNGLTSGVIASAGTIGTVMVDGDIIGGNLNDLSGVIGSAKAMTSVTVTGSLKGGDANSSGQIVSITTIGSITVQGNVEGGKGFESGALGALGSLGTIAITGKIVGGMGESSGAVLTGANLAKLTVDAIDGGEGDLSGHVGVAGTLTKLIVNHDVTGGPGNFSAIIEGGFGSHAKSIFIGGSLIAHPGSGAAGIPAPISTAVVAYDGTIASVEVVGDLKGQGATSGAIYSTAQISKVVVHGSLFGGAGFLSGSIFTERSDAGAAGLGSVTVEGNLNGGAGQLSGSIRSVASIASVTVGTIGATPNPGPVLDTSAAIILPIGTGNLTGSGAFSAQILATDNIGTVKVAGSLNGGGNASARISAGGNLTSVLVEGSVSGNAANYSVDDRTGQINAVKLLSSVIVKGSVNGGSGSFSSAITGGSIGSVDITNNLNGGTTTGAGSILALTGKINTVHIGGDIVGKNVAAESARTTAAAGSIEALTTIGTITVDGGISGLTGTPVVISAGGNLNPTTDAQALAIKSVRVAGVMSFTQVLAGYSINGAGVNGDVQIGTIDVGTSTLDLPGGFWFDNDIIAGMATTQPPFGSNADFVITNGASTPLLSKIAKVIVRGDMGGSLSRHGIDAELVGSIVVNGVAEHLTPGAHNDFFAIAGDFTQNTYVYENPPTT